MTLNSQNNCIKDNLFKNGCPRKIDNIDGFELESAFLSVDSKSDFTDIFIKQMAETDIGINGIIGKYKDISFPEEIDFSYSSKILEKCSSLAFRFENAPSEYYYKLHGQCLQHFTKNKPNSGTLCVEGKSNAYMKILLINSKFRAKWNNSDESLTEYYSNFINFGFNDSIQEHISLQDDHIVLSDMSYMYCSDLKCQDDAVKDLPKSITNFQILIDGKSIDKIELNIENCYQEFQQNSEISSGLIFNQDLKTLKDALQSNFINKIKLKLPSYYSKDSGLTPEILTQIREILKDEGISHQYDIDTGASKDYEEVKTLLTTPNKEISLTSQDKINVDELIQILSEIPVQPQFIDEFCENRKPK